MKNIKNSFRFNSLIACINTLSVGVAGQILFNDQEIITDVPLISGHSVHVDLIPRLQNALPSQPPISHNDCGCGSHSFNLDNDGTTSSILSQNKEQNNQENEVLIQRTQQIMIQLKSLVTVPVTLLCLLYQVTDLHRKIWQTSSTLVPATGFCWKIWQMSSTPVSVTGFCRKIRRTSSTPVPATGSR